MNWLRLHVSNLCNFKCPNCHVFELGENVLPNRVMSQEIFNRSIETFIAILKRRGSQKTTISLYGGETLANKQVIKNGLLKFGDHYQGVDLNWVLNTNGSLLKEEDILFFKRFNLEVHISVDGKEEIHNLARPTHKGKGTYHLVKPALELIRKHKLPAQINSYVMPFNFNHLQDIVDIAAEYNLQKIYLDQFYNLEMIPHHVGMKKYMSVYLYGMSKGINVSGPWNKVINNFHNNETREETLKKSFSLDVNIDGSCYFPVYSESKNMNYHIDQIDKLIQEEEWQKIIVKTFERNFAKGCNSCELKDHCNGLAIEQVHYHIGLEADTKVSCDFFRDWTKFLKRPVMIKQEKQIDYISVLEQDIEPVIKVINKEIIGLEKKLWPLQKRATVNFLEHYEEMRMVSRIESLPEWVKAFTYGSTLYLRGTGISPALVHELTHLFLNQENVKGPQWFIEGFCEWVQGYKIDSKLLRYNLKTNNLFDVEENVSLIEIDNQIPQKNPFYIQAHAFVCYLNSITGDDLLKQIVLALNEQELSDVLVNFTGATLKDHIQEFVRLYS